MLTMCLRLLILGFITGLGFSDFEFEKCQHREADASSTKALGNKSEIACSKLGPMNSCSFSFVGLSIRRHALYTFQRNPFSLTLLRGYAFKDFPLRSHVSITGMRV